MGLKPTTPRCGAAPRTGPRSRKRGPCSLAAGWGTDHPGEGRCKLHGGRQQTGVTHGRYATIKRPRIRELIEAHQGDKAPLDTLPELAAVRALFVDYIERYDEMTDALIAWHSWKPEGSTTERPDRPRQVLDLADAYRLLSEATKIVERIERKNALNAISQPELFKLMANLGRVVETYVTDPDVLTKIREGWMNLGANLRTSEPYSTGGTS